MKLHSERKPGKELYISRIMSRFLAAEKKYSPILFWALIVGIITGIVAALFQLSIEKVLDSREFLLGLLPQNQAARLIVSVLFSAVLVFIAFLLVRRLAPEASGSGVHEIEGALDEVRPIRWKNVLPVKFIGGALSLGGGMVLGREGPTIHMGGNIGKMVADLFKAAREDTHALIAAGAGAGLTAAFNAPLAGILFVFEEMRPEFRYNFLSVQSVIIASAASDIALRSIMGQGPDIEMAMLPPPPLTSLWLFVIFGFLFGILGVVFNFFLIRTLDYFSSLKGPAFTLTGLYVGGFIGLVAWLYPDMAGGGYVVIPEAISGVIPVTMLILLFFARFGTTMISYGSGAPGGIFAPMLALGTLFGMWYGNVAVGFLPALDIKPELFAVAGMAALFCATVRAPLTGIAITIEMTGNYFLILPLIITCLTATLVAEGLGGKPVYTLLLKRTLSLARK
ncbi:MAG: H(+)/Cl(-) exchange transporter ClcA [Thermodesulfobacteriota bacterium]